MTVDIPFAGLSGDADRVGGREGICISIMIDDLRRAAAPNMDRREIVGLVGRGFSVFRASSGMS